MGRYSVGRSLFHTLVGLGAALMGCGAGVFGCATQELKPVVANRVLPSPVVSRTEEVLDPKLLEAAAGDEDGRPYRIGPGDTLLVAVYNHPELALSTYAGAMGASATTPNGRPAGLYVDPDGPL